MGQGYHPVLLAIGNQQLEGNLRSSTTTREACLDEMGFGLRRGRLFLRAKRRAANFICKYPQYIKGDEMTLTLYTILYNPCG